MNAGREIAYIEHAAYPAQWLRNLCERGHLPQGNVIERDIREVSANDLRNYAQVHAFAGIGGWPYALRLAGWPDDAPVWTGSCPCQPFSRAGKRKGTADSRHLWPIWFSQIAECKPAVVFGEQVAGPDGLAWLDLISTDLESIGYAFAAADLCAAGVGAPHIRQRLFFAAVRMGDSNRFRLQSGLSATGPGARRQTQCAGNLDNLGMGDPLCEGSTHHQLVPSPAKDSRSQGSVRVSASVLAGKPCHIGMANNRGGRCQLRRHQAAKGSQVCGLDIADGLGRQRRGAAPQEVGEHEAFWAGEAFWEWLYLRDGTVRPTKPGVHVVAHGVPARVAKLRALGNAIVPQVAAAFVTTVMESLREPCR